MSSSLLRHNYGESPIPASRILDLLRVSEQRSRPIRPAHSHPAVQDWSGVSQILTRNLFQNRRNDVILITSVGTATARQRLARLLLLPIDKLRRAIRDELLSQSVREKARHIWISAEKRIFFLFTGEVYE